MTNLCMTYFIVCGVMSFAAFVLFGMDKSRAKRGLARFPELTLLTLAALGGAVGALLGMLLFRHKINFGRKAHFVLSVPICLGAQIFLGLVLYGVLPF